MKGFSKVIVFSALCFSLMPGQVYAQVDADANNTATTSNILEGLVADIRRVNSPSLIEQMTDDALNAKADKIHKEQEQAARESEIEKSRKNDLGEIVEDVTVEDYGVCQNPGTSHIKTYMDGAKITNTASAQYQLLQTMHVNEHGHYVTDDGYLAVALGSFYGPIGSKYVVTLDNGKQFKVIKGDEKADQHVYNGCYHRVDGSVLEFILDTPAAAEYYGLVNGYVAGGSLGRSSEFAGEIEDIQAVID